VCDAKNQNPQNGTLIDDEPADAFIDDTAKKTGAAMMQEIAKQAKLDEDAVAEIRAKVRAAHYGSRLYGLFLTLQKCREPYKTRVFAVPKIR